MLPHCPNHFRILILFSSLRYFLFVLKLSVFASSKRIDVQERRVATCFPSTLRARPGSQANAALEGHSHISHSTAAGNPPQPLTYTIPLSATRTHARTYERVHRHGLCLEK
jgi:hypothetical protein